MQDDGPQSGTSASQLQRGSRKLLILAGVVFLAAGIFFVGRRAYYRMIRPAPLWTVPTPRTEKIVCADEFEVALWAGENLVSNPTSLCLDERGRVWLTEAVHYRDRENDRPNTRRQGDRVVILEDTDRDGKADSRIVFAQDPDLTAPLGILVLGSRAFVSCSPAIYVFTDDNGDDKADRKEVLLTGFGGHDHDHGVHGLVPGPDGRLYFAVGNAGPHKVTDQSGWTLRSGSYYQWRQRQTEAEQVSVQPLESDESAVLNSGGLVSDDGDVYAGGLVLSILPDGTDLRVHSHNARNPYEVAVDSFGDLWQSDNDDTLSCRITWLMHGANTGFASADGSRSWQLDQRPWQSTAEAHWHQDDPGVIPAGLIYGTGAPTGLMRYENADGRLRQGTLLACDAGLGCVHLFRPVVHGAGFRFESSRLVWSEQMESSVAARPDGLALTWFRPTDIAASANGDLYVSDWYDSYVGGHRVNDEAAAGRIYVLRPRDSSLETADVIGPADDDPIAMAADQLRSNSVSARWHAREKLLSHGESAIPVLRALQQSDDRFLHARVLWILAMTGMTGQQYVSADLAHEDPQIRITAMRSLVAAGALPISVVSRMVNDPSPAVLRECAVLLRNVPPEQSRSLLIGLAGQLNGLDRAALEAFGLACEGLEDEIYTELQLRMGYEPGNWSEHFSWLVWRLRPVSALPDLQERLRLPGLDIEMRRRTVETIAHTATPQAADLLQEYAAFLRGQQPHSEETPNPDSSSEVDPEVARVLWWAERLKSLKIQESNSGTAPGASLNVQFQPVVRPVVNQDKLQQILALEGDAVRGHDLFAGTKATCSVCHRFGERGGDLGPNLTAVRVRLDRSQLVEAILYPSSAIVTGYEAWAVTDTDGRTTTGLLQSAGQTILLKSVDGKMHSIPAASVEQLTRQGISLMPESPGTILSDQEIADIVAYLWSREPHSSSNDVSSDQN